MKKIILTLALMVFVAKSYSQNTIEYVYDANGNRTERRLYVCPSCPIGQRKVAPTAKDDSTQTLAMQHGINVFPNPTQDKVMLTISNLQDEEPTQVFVTDETGTVLYTSKNVQSQNEINMANYTSGTYFIRIVIGKKVLTYKVIKV
ncbi:MAG: T9SS type A sorting domain-containing protein [Bacteroidetes bacterium]|nr:T9SS type A sorting domain-containing protein [Bacteroidota bacterium]